MPNPRTTPHDHVWMEATITKGPDDQVGNTVTICAICHTFQVRVEVELYKPSGKYYTTEQWIVPDKAIGPYDMDRSPDFHRISNGAVLIPAQEPWGFPHLFPAIDD